MDKDTQAKFEKALTQIPYAKLLGVRPIFMGNDMTMVLPVSEENIGNPFSKIIHGGAIGGLMELTAIFQITLAHPEESIPIPIGVNIDYLRPGEQKDSFAKANITRHGRRIVNVNVNVWQDDPDKPIASLHGHFLIRRKE